MRRFTCAGLLLVATATCSSQVLAWEPSLNAMPGALNALELPNGEALDLKSLQGAPVVIYVGAEWCVPCVTSGRPAVLRAYEKFRARGLKVVYVSMDDNSYRSALRAWTEPLGISLLMAKLAACPEHSCAKGSDGNLGAFGRAYRFPSAFVLDSAGVVRVRYEAARDIRTRLEGDVEPLLVKH
jgi:thiol-disulfide isomerase/thioredoxin